MDLVAIFNSLAVSAPWLMPVLSILGALVVIAQVVVMMTPSKADDALLDKVEKSGIGSMILNALKAFAPIQKK